MNYPVEELGQYIDDGTMVNNVNELSDAVVGHKIVDVTRTDKSGYITLDNGKVVELLAGEDCCAYTELEAFLLNPELVNHIITGVGTTDGYETWHIYADMGDVLQLTVGWSSGNPFYYGYGFYIKVR